MQLRQLAQRTKYMNEQEKKVIELCGQVWMEYASLPVQRQGELTEILHHIRAIQNAVLAREAERRNPELKTFIR